MIIISSNKNIINNNSLQLNNSKGKIFNITNSLSNESHELNQCINSILYVDKNKAQISHNASKDSHVKLESTFDSLCQSLGNGTIKMSSNVSHPANTSAGSANKIESNPTSRNYSKNIPSNPTGTGHHYSRAISNKGSKFNSFANIIKNKGISFLHKIKQLYHGHKNYDPKKYKYVFCANCGYCCKSSNKFCPHCGYQLH